MHLEGFFLTGTSGLDSRVVRDAGLAKKHTSEILTSTPRLRKDTQIWTGSKIKETQIQMF